MSFANVVLLWTPLVVGQGELRPAPLPEPESLAVVALELPDQPTPEQRAHLEQAAQRLRDGGLPHIALQLEAALQSARQAMLHKTLEEKQAQVQALEREIAELRKQLEIREPIVLQFKILKVDRDRLSERDPALFAQLTTRLLSQRGAPVQDDPATRPLEISDLLQRLCGATESGAVSVLSAPKILTLDGQEAKVVMGGQFPIVIDATPEPFFEYHDFGTTIAVRPKLVSSECVHCYAKYEQSELNFDHAVVTTAGTNVPGLTMQCVNTQFTASFGETVLLPCLALQPTVTLIFATVERGTPTTTATAAPPTSPAVWTKAENAAYEEVELSFSRPPVAVKSPQWISPISLLMRTLLETDTSLNGPGVLKVSGEPVVLPQPQPEPTPR